jgi:hypothetical protein
VSGGRARQWSQGGYGSYIRDGGAWRWVLDEIDQNANKQ